MRRLIFPLILGLGGVAILLALGTWQLQRLDWKQGILAEIDARIGDTPIDLPLAPTADADEYLPVTVTGTLTGDRLRVLTSIKDVGPGFRVIEAFETTDGRRILIDRGFVKSGEQDQITTATTAVTGNLLWPDETDNWTPDPEGDLWFARDTAAMAAALSTEPTLIVARQPTPADPVIRTLPIDTSAISNDHLNYAITWFLLAAVWAVMSGALAWRAARPT